MKILASFVSFLWLLGAPFGLLSFAYSGFRFSVLLSPWKWMLGLIPANGYDLALWIWLYSFPIIIWLLWYAYRPKRLQIEVDVFE